MNILTTNVFSDLGEEWVMDSGPTTYAVISAIDQTTERKCFLPPELVRIIVDYLQSAMFVFREKNWTTFGQVRPAPALPDNIEEILQAVKKKCILIYIPREVNGNLLTCHHMQSLAQKITTEQNQSKFAEESWEDAIKEHGDVHSGDVDHWTLITEDVVPESMGKSYSDQQALTKSTSRGQWQVASFRDVVISMVLRKAISGKQLYDKTFIRCPEITNGQRILVGFTPDGLSIDQDDFNYEDSAVAAAMIL